MKDHKQTFGLLTLLWLIATGCLGSLSQTTPESSTLMPQAAMPTSDLSQVTAVPDFITPTLLIPSPTATADIPSPAPYEGLPTPDPPHYSADQYNRVPHLIRSGETLSSLSERYDIPLAQILEANGLGEDDIIAAGQTIAIPMPLEGVSNPFKIIPNSELVYGPTVTGFDTGQFMQRFYPNSPLGRYSEGVEGRPLNGIQIVDLVAVRYSINPRLLLAVIEYRSGWVTQFGLDPVANPYPLNHFKDGFDGLYTQLSWAANQINLDYYGRLEGGLTSIPFEDGSRIAIEPTLNHGTAGVQNWLAAHDGANRTTWEQEIGPDGFFATYQRLFGNPFGLAYAQPLVPAGIQQPELTFPWERGVPWYFTGGPHGGWAGGSAWAALDFAPDKDRVGCYLSETWITAPADGTIVYSGFGGLILDLDNDGNPGTGWTIVIWHVDERERVPIGRLARRGDRLGHASCEGGFSNGTHIHFARRYNGQWISADGAIPFNIEGWISQGTGNEYDGYLIKGGQSLEACVCAEEDVNEIRR